MITTRVESSQLLVAPEAFFLRIPGPGSFLQLDFHFAEESFVFVSMAGRTLNCERYYIAETEPDHCF